VTSRPPIQGAVIDDYQGIALRMADWSVLAGRAVVTLFGDHLVDPAAVAALAAIRHRMCDA